MKKITKIDVPERPEKRRLQVAAYARVSTDSDEQLVSLDAQKTYYEKLIRNNPDWDYAGLYYDEGISGTKTDKRDGLLRMLEDCRKGKINFIIVKSISRLARNTVDTLEIVRELTDLGIFIFFEKENIDTSSMQGELMLTILSSLAQSESASISANEKWSIQKRFEQGTFVIGYPPYGYENVDGKMVIVPEQAEVVRWIFREFLNGKGTYRLANELNEKGVPSKKGGKWTPSGVNGMLRNEKYTGDVLYQKSYTDEQFNRHRNLGDAAQYYVRDHHEPIISHEVFEAAQALLIHNGKQHGNLRGATKYLKRYSFSGKLICGDCGSTFKRRTHTTVEGNYYAYSCNTHLADKTKCGMLYICEDRLQTAFTNMMNKLICCHAQVLKPLLESYRQTSYQANQERTDELNALLDENAAKRRNLLDLFSKEYLDSSMYHQMDSMLETEAGSLTEERDALIRSASMGEGNRRATEELLSICENSEPSSEFQESLVDRFMDHAIINSRDEVTFVLTCGLKLTERM